MFKVGDKVVFTDEFKEWALENREGKFLPDDPKFITPMLKTLDKKYLVIRSFSENYPKRFQIKSDTMSFWYDVRWVKKYENDLEKAKDL